MLKVIVKRSNWYRGQGSKGSMLRVKDGRMCCLGFACIVAGLKADEITGIGSPGELNGEGVDVPGELFGLLEEVETDKGDSTTFKDNGICEDLMRLNDQEAKYLDLIKSEAEREAALIAEGVNAGIAFEFVD